MFVSRSGCYQIRVMCNIMPPTHTYKFMVMAYICIQLPTYTHTGPHGPRHEHWTEEAQHCMCISVARTSQVGLAQLLSVHVCIYICIYTMHICLLTPSILSIVHFCGQDKSISIAEKQRACTCMYLLISFQTLLVYVCRAKSGGVYCTERVSIFLIFFGACVHVLCTPLSPCTLSSGLAHSGFEV
jgi:hypothetical protein